MDKDTKKIRREVLYPRYFFLTFVLRNEVMARYFVELSYMGKAYCGWQRQPNAPTVQQELETRLSTLLREPVEVVGAGRTDAGVNSSFYVAHFDTQSPIADREQLCYKLNRTLPLDIAVKAVRPVRADAHARFDARWREYRYYLSPHKSPFTHTLAWYYAVPLDIDRMNEAAACLLDCEDFTTFAKLGSNNHTNICRLSEARWQVLPDGVWCFTIRADRFLRNMVRSIVGTLVDVGRGRYTVEEFREILLSRDLSRASAGAPACGLYLSGVGYDDNVYVCNDNTQK